MSYDFCWVACWFQLSSGLLIFIVVVYVLKNKERLMVVRNIVSYINIGYGPYRLVEPRMCHSPCVPVHTVSTDFITELSFFEFLYCGGCHRLSCDFPYPYPYFDSLYVEQVGSKNVS